ncbi:MAG TPA: hypothetical protein VIE69_05895 [Methylophilaceae bacterium]
MFNKNVVRPIARLLPIVVLSCLMFPAAANAKSATLASNDDAMFSSIGMQANASYNEFFMLSMPSADGGTAIDSLGAGMPSSVTMMGGASSPSFQAVNAQRLALGNDAPHDIATDGYSAKMAGPELWTMLLIGVGLVAFRLRRRPDTNVFSYA